MACDFDENLMQVTSYEVLGKLPTPFICQDGTVADTEEKWAKRRCWRRAPSLLRKRRAISGLILSDRGRRPWRLVSVIEHQRNGTPVEDTFFVTPFKQPALIFDWQCPDKKTRLTM